MKESLEATLKDVELSKEVYRPKTVPNVGHSMPMDVGNQCPAHGLSMPSTWSLSAHVTGIKRPCPWTLFN